MSFIKKWLPRLVFPPIIIILLLIFASTAMLIYAFAVPGANRHIAYVSYFLAFYSFVVVCLRIPEAYRDWNALKSSNSFLIRFFSDVRFRTQLSLFFSHIWNSAYAALQLLSGFYYHSFWFYSLAAYYAILAIMRWALLRDIRSSDYGFNRIAELKRYRICGVTLLLLNQALAVIVIMIVYLNRGFNHNNIFIIGMGIYSFTAITLAVKNLIKYGKYNSPVVAAAKIVSFTSAMVSFLSLETAMIEAFGTGENPALRRMIIGFTGALVCAFVLVLAIRMIWSSTKELWKLTHQNS